MDKVESLRDVLMHELKDLYSAESQILKALPKAIKAASNPSLRESLSSHLEETQVQLSRLEQIGKKLGEKLTGETCEAMQGLIEETEEVLDFEAEPAFIDTMLIAACQKIEHYEMSGYGTCRSIAEELDLTEIAELLQTTLDEEKNADKTLSLVSENEVLSESAAYDQDSNDDDEESESRGKKSSVTAAKKDKSGRGRDSHSSR